MIYLVSLQRNNDLYDGNWAEVERKKKWKKKAANKFRKRNRINGKKKGKIVSSMT